MRATSVSEFQISLRFAPGRVLLGIHGCRKSEMTDRTQNDLEH